jgi:hypothetical protein
MAGGHDGKPLDYDALELWTRAHHEPRYEITQRRAVTQL